MKKKLKVIITSDEKKFVECSYIELDSYAPNTSRKLLFKNLKIKNDVKIYYGQFITIDIWGWRKDNKRIWLSGFKMLVFDGNEEDEEKSDFWLSGLIYCNNEVDYNQGIIDVFNLWQQGKDIDWFELPLGSYLKKDYIDACYFYSTLNPSIISMSSIIEKDVYEIDASLIKEDRDFIYLASRELFGNRAYMGHSFHTFKDCLIILFDERGYFQDKKIRFLNVSKIFDSKSLSIFEDFKKIFINFKFGIEEMA